MAFPLSGVFARKTFPKNSVLRLISARHRLGALPRAAAAATANANEAKCGARARAKKRKERRESLTLVRGFFRARENEMCCNVPVSDEFAVWRCIRNVQN